MKKWNKESCGLEAKKFKTKIEWINFSKYSYEVSRINGWLDELCSHMVKEIKTSKICNLCKIEKDRACFNKDYTVKNGLRSLCKECQSFKNAEYRKNSDKQAKKDYMREYAVLKREEINAKARQRRLDNPDKVREMERKKSVKKLKSVKYKLSHALRSRINSAIKGGYKNGSAVRDLGCSIEELKNYLQSKFQEGMSWDNWGKTGWHIDHIKPLSSFNLEDRKELLKACHYTNLQPLWYVDNLKKYNKIVKDESFYES